MSITEKINIISQVIKASKNLIQVLEHFINEGTTDFLVVSTEDAIVIKAALENYVESLEE